MSRRRTSSGLGGEQIEGRRAVRELLIAGRRRVHQLWIADDGGDDRSDLIDLAEANGVRVRRVGRDDLDRRARTEAHQGVVAMTDPVEPAELSELLASDAAFLVALDGVTDPQNLGAILRGAETAGATGVVLPRRGAAHITPTVAKAAAGALEYLPIALVAGIPAAITQAARADVWTIGLDAGGDVTIDELTVADRPLVLIFGAEGHGLSRLVRERCDALARIPMHGYVASLNVAAAVAIACAAVARARTATLGAPPE